MEQNEMKKHQTIKPALVARMPRIVRLEPTGNGTEVGVNLHCPRCSEPDPHSIKSEVLGSDEAQGEETEEGFEVISTVTTRETFKCQNLFCLTEWDMVFTLPY